VRPWHPRLAREASATRGYLIASSVLGVLTAAAMVGQATVLAGAIAGVFLDGADLARLRGPLLALAALAVTRAGLAWAQDATANRAAARVTAQLRSRLLTHVVALGPGWLTSQRSGELSTLATRGLDALDTYFSRYLPQLVLAALIPAVVLARVLPADLSAGLTILLTLPLIPLFMALIGRSAQQRDRRQFALLARLAHHFLDVVTGLGTLKAYRRAGAQAQTIRTATDEYRRASLATLRVAFLSSLVLELIATLSVALVAVGIGLRLVSGSISLQTALVVLILAPEAYLPLRQVGTHYHASAQGLAAATEVFAVLDQAPPPAGGRTDLVGAGVALVLDRVSVCYPDRPPVLRDFSLTVHPGQIVALTGPSGCGKSTLLRALLGFAPLAGGRICLGSGPAAVDLADAAPAAWRSRIAWVPQHPYLFAGSVADNIRLGRPGASDSQVRAAARLARVEDLLDAPARLDAAAGPDTAGGPLVIGDDGAGLSTGQRQRIALARAFLADAPVLLLDEPTANLDGDNEAAILAGIRALAADRTVLMVAHRPALIELADRVVTVPGPERAPAATPAAVPTSAATVAAVPIPAATEATVPG
jgi:thiol reductant ABC exporter CydD subunit